MVVYHKRKPDIDKDTYTVEFTGRSSSIPMVYVVRPSVNSISWTSIQQQMKQLSLGDLSSWEEKEEEDKDPEGSLQDAQDDLLAFLGHEILPLQNNFDDWVSQQTELAKSVKSRLSEELIRSERKNALHMERVRARQLQHEKHERARAELLQELEVTKQAIALAQDEVVLNKHKTSMFLLEREEMEDYRNIHEGKLRRRIALYATCTGIKFNFDAPRDTLEAQVMVPSKEEFCLVALNHNEMSQFEIANTLWDTAEGKESKEISVDHSVQLMGSLIGVLSHTVSPYGPVSSRSAYH